MMSFIKGWVLNIVMIIIFITFLEILMPNSKMKKYINMMIGLLVMLVILNPLLELASGKIKMENEIIKTSSMLDKRILELNIDKLEKGQENQMIALYKYKIEKNIQDRLEFNNDLNVVSVKSEIEENRQDKDFGKIKKLEVILSSDPIGKHTSNVVEHIPPVKVSISEKNTEEIANTVSTNGQATFIEDLRIRISDLYGLDKEKVYIGLYDNN